MCLSHSAVSAELHREGGCSSCASSGAFWGRRGCVGSVELEFISHRSRPSAVLPVGAGKEFLTHPCSGLGTAGTASALCLSIAHIQELGWVRSQWGTQPGQLTHAGQGDVPDPQLRAKSEGRDEGHSLFVFVCQSSHSMC